MSEPKIDPFWNSDSSIKLRPFFVIGIPVLLLVLSVVLSGLKGCTQLGEQGSKDVYNPAEYQDGGFVGGANRLLDELLLDTLEGECPVTDLESLNAKYKALIFGLPYGEEHKSVIEASDLRLIGIRADRIQSEASRMFYYNSRLPQLLQQQKDQIAETYFRIFCQGLDYDKSKGKKPIKVTKVEIIPSMFKVALTKDPWVGTVEGAQNCLFDEDNAVFLNFGNSILPLPKLRRADLTNSIKLQAVADEATLLTVRGNGIDYYDVYKTLFKANDDGRKACANIVIVNSSGEADTKSPYFTLCCAHDSLYIRSKMKMRVFGKSSTYEFAAKESGYQKDDVVPVEDGMKIVAYNADDYKIAEFSLFTKDPTRTLSRLSLTNVGRERINLPAEHSDLFTRQVVRGLSQNMSNTYNIDMVHLSLDPMLSHEFEKEVKNYLYAVKRQIGTPKHIKRDSEQYDISLTVMDMATGDILASPYYTTRFDEIPEEMHITTRNPALTRRFVGSAFKPMVALASVLTNPSLLQLDTHGKYHLDESGDRATFFGRRTNAWAKKQASHWNGSKFPDFLSYSDDVYPVALATLAMSGAKVDKDVSVLPLTGDNNYFKQNRGGMLYFRNEQEVSYGAQNPPFNDWLTYLYAVNYDTDSHTDTIFKNLYTQNNLNHQDRRYGLDELIPDATNLYLNRFLEGKEFRQMLPPWVLGQGDNQWNCVKLAEAWCRMLTKRDVLATLIHNDNPLSSLIDDVDSEPAKRTVYGPATRVQTNSIWNRFLESFAEAQNFNSYHGSTLQRMYNQVQNLNESGIDNQLVLFSKTGTPDIYDRYDIPLIGGNRRKIDIGMYCFGLMDKSQFELVKLNKPAKGIVAVVRVTRTYECARCSRGNGTCKQCEDFKGVSSVHARNFFSENANRLRKFYEMTHRYY